MRNPGSLRGARRAGRNPVLLNGFLTGLLLQAALGPVFFFLLSTVLQKTPAHGLVAVLAVTLVDALYILLAVLGVGRLLERTERKRLLGIIGSLVLLLFGLAMIASGAKATGGAIAAGSGQPAYGRSFLSALVLTGSSPLTIVFWTGLFTARALEKGYAKKQLLLFGLGAVAATPVFLGLSVTLVSFIKQAIPVWAVKSSNIVVGGLLLLYGLLRLAGALKRRQPAAT